MQTSIDVELVFQTLSKITQRKVTFAIVQIQNEKVM